MTHPHVRRCRIWMWILPLGFLASGAVAGDRSEQRTLAVKPDGLVRIINTSGSTRIRGWAKAEVKVDAELGGGVKRLDVVEEAGAVRIEVVLNDLSVRNGSADLVVYLPDHSALEVTAVSADIQLKALSGRTRLKSVSGDVVATISSDDVDLQTVSGDAILIGGDADGTARLQSVSGDVSVQAFVGSVDAVSVSGDVKISMGPMFDVRLRSTSGDVAVHGVLQSNTRIEAENMSGDIKLQAAGRSGFTTEIESFSGDIGGCFRDQVTRASEHGPGKRLYMTQGDGSARVRAKSFSGDVVFCGD